MQKQMKLITVAGILGLFLVGNYAFEFLGKIGAGIVSAVLTEQLPAEAWNNDLYAAIWQQSLPFLIMILIGVVLLQWKNTKIKALAEANLECADCVSARKESDLAVVGGLLFFVGCYNLFLPIYFGYQDIIGGLSSPESAGYVLKAILPNYIVLLVQMALGIWLVIGKKAKEVSVEATVEIENAGLAIDEDLAAPVEIEIQGEQGHVETVDNASGDIATETEAPVVAEEVDKVQ